MPIALVAPSYQPQTEACQGQLPVAGVAMSSDPEASYGGQGYGQPIMAEQIPVGMHPAQQVDQPFQPAPGLVMYAGAPTGSAPMAPKKV